MIFLHTIINKMEYKIEYTVNGISYINKSSSNYMKEYPMFQEEKSEKIWKEIHKKNNILNKNIK